MRAGVHQRLAVVRSYGDGHRAHHLGFAFAGLVFFIRPILHVAQYIVQIDGAAFFLLCKEIVLGWVAVICESAILFRFAVRDGNLIQRLSDPSQGSVVLQQIFDLGSQRSLERSQ